MMLKYDHYYTYNELVGAMKGLVEAHPDLARLEVIGKSGEGRDLVAIIITNSKTGPDDSKPGYYIDGNHHAGECVGSMASLYTADYLLSNYGTNAQVTRLVDTCSFYIHPRVSPDGTEVYLTTPETMRSVPRYYPYLQWEEMDGLYPADVNGDGEILLMRVEDPNGEWKVSSKDKRAMAKRAPDEVEGTFYRVYQEGFVRNYTGKPIKNAPLKWGLDLNRNYPAEWGPEVVQSGAGPYPLSEPETKAVADFVIAHPNICIAMTNHTTGGVLLAVPGSCPPSKIPQHDWAVLKALGKIGTQVTGYPCISIFEEFHAKSESWSHGAADDWLYLHRGIVAYTTELWNLATRAGVKMWPRTEKDDEEQEDDFVKMLQWQDKELGGEGFVDWTPFDHPQLGKVEIGGWKPKFVVQNAPPAFLPSECAKISEWFVRTAEALPHLSISEVNVEKAGEGAYVVSCLLANTGYLPTYGTKKALELKLHLPLTIELCGEGIEVMGSAKQTLGQLEGRAASQAQFWMGYFRGDSPTRETRVKWTVKAAPGASGKITAKSARAGTAVAEFTI